MLHASLATLGHIVSAAQHERDRLAAIHEVVGDDWPEGFDANDIPLYDILIECLKNGIQERKQELDFSGKSLVFLLRPLPAYVRVNREKLSATEYEEIRSLYERWAWQTGSSTPFPE